MNTKRCSACLQVKPLEEFQLHKHSNGKSIYYSRCKLCLKLGKPSIEFERTCRECGTKFISYIAHATRQLCPLCREGYKDRVNQRQALMRKGIVIDNPPPPTPKTLEAGKCLACRNYKICCNEKPEYIPPCLVSSPKYDRRLGSPA